MPRRTDSVRDPAPTPGSRPEPGAAARPQLTVDSLTEWEESGATWRTLEISDERVVVELCTCYGEPVDVLSGESPELISFIRARPAADR